MDKTPRKKIAHRRNISNAVVKLQLLEHKNETKLYLTDVDYIYDPFDLHSQTQKAVPYIQLILAFMPDPRNRLTGKVTEATLPA